jgi:hypothetical protein
LVVSPILKKLSNAPPAGRVYSNTELAPRDIALNYMAAKSPDAPQSRLDPSPKSDGASNSDAPAKRSSMKCGGSTETF